MSMNTALSFIMTTIGNEEGKIIVLETVVSVFSDVLTAVVQGNIESFKKIKFRWHLEADVRVEPGRNSKATELGAVHV